MKREAAIRRAARISREVILQLKSAGKLQPALDALGIPPVPAEQFWGVNREAILFFREFVKSGGMMLDAGFWQVENGASGALKDAIEAALVNGWSASKAAGKFMYEGSANEVVQPNIDLSGYSDGQDRVNEVFCSEINRAHGEAYMAAGEGTPGFAGWRYLLSPAHPRPDICDLLSTQNLHGLGPGVYPTRETTPWPAHPNTLSFVVIVFKADVSAADRAGKETSLQAMQRLTPKRREGALGQTKAKYFDQGLLRSWMIRSPLVSVQRRLVRLGLLDRQALEKDPDPYDESEEEDQ